MAALLAHRLSLDLSNRQLSHEECMDERHRLGLTAKRWDNGRQQMEAATAMHIGLVAISDAHRCFTVYRPHRGAGPDHQVSMYAVLRVGLNDGQHTEPFPTRGGSRCGLVSLAKACEMLEQLGLANRTLDGADEYHDLD